MGLNGATEWNEGGDARFDRDAPRGARGDAAAAREIRPQTGKPAAHDRQSPFRSQFRSRRSADMIRESTREFADGEIAPRAAAIDRDNQFPRDLWPKMGALGLHGITAPEEYGGLGLGYL